MSFPRSRCGGKQRHSRSYFAPYQCKQSLPLAMVFVQEKHLQCRFDLAQAFDRSVRRKSVEGSANGGLALSLEQRPAKIARCATPDIARRERDGERTWPGGALQRTPRRPRP